MDLNTANAVLSLLEAGERLALVSMLETTGSSPRHSGAAMVVKTDGSIVGTVGGGALEGRAIRTALDVLEARTSRLMDFELTAADSAGLGMICGGKGLLLIEYLDGAAGADTAVCAALVRLLGRGGQGWLVTGVAAGGATEPGRAAAPAVKRALVDSTGTVVGDPPCPLEALQALPKMGGTLDGHTAGGLPGVYVQSVGAPGTVYVFGAGHCGRSLVPVLSMVGFRTVVVDDRADFANADRFPDADAVEVPAAFHDSLAALPIDTRSYLVIMTRGHVFDRSVLAQALRTPARYIGMIGSKKKIAATYEALRGEGFTDEDFARVRSPIGMAIGAETPEEIAVAIAAEIIQARRG